MEFLLSAALGDLSSRLVSGLISFFVKKCSKPTALDVEDNLQKALLRAHVITDEAMRRHITNHAMLLQLDSLRKAIYQGCYKLDTFRYQSQNEGTKKQVGSRFASLSEVNSVKGLFFSIRDKQNLDELQDVLDNLRSMILDAKELVLFLTSYPCLYRQPYSMHLLLGNCMFGRQMEVEFVINFLLNKQPHGSEELQVLPIVGPSKVSKSTLVAHVCKDERVSDHFSEIIFLRDHDFTDDQLAIFREGSARKQQNWLPKSNKEGKRLLVVDELAENLNEDAWNKLTLACISSGSKIIVTSQSDKIIKFGTQALTMKHLSHEALWYFFKTLTFGSSDPTMHPRLAYLAMEITRLLDGTLFRANIIANILRDNFDIHFWRKFLTFLRGITKKHVETFGEHPFNDEDQNIPACYPIIGSASKSSVIYHQYYQRSSEEEVPNIILQDMIFENVKPLGKFEILAWSSKIPPYHSYVYVCEIQELKIIGVKRKRSMKNGATLC